MGWVNIRQVAPTFNVGKWARACHTHGEELYLSWFAGNKNSFGKAMLTHSDFALTCQNLPQVTHRELHGPERLEKTRCLIWQNALQLHCHKISPQSGWCWQGQYHVGWATRGVALSALEQPRRRQIHHRIIARGLCSRR